MKKLRNAIFASVISIGGAIAPIQYVHAAPVGVPTVDIGALVQSLVSYAQDLRDYAESVYRNAVLGNEYVQTIRKVQQMYREYDHMLNQIRGIRDAVSNEDWNAILVAAKLDFPMNPLDTYWDMNDPNLQNDDNYQRVNNDLNARFDRMTDVSESGDIIDNLYRDEELTSREHRDLDVTFEFSKGYEEKKLVLDYLESEQTNIDAMFETLKRVRRENATGDESQLRTLQVIALQQELQLKMLNLQNKTARQNYKESNNQYLLKKQKQAYQVERKLKNKNREFTGSGYRADPNRYRSVNF